MKSLNNIKGFTLLELSLSIAIFVIISTGVVVPVIGNYLTNLENQKMVQANALLTESWEAVRAIRNNDWVNVANGVYGLQNTNGYWEFSGNSDIFNGFTRRVTVSNIYRDANGYRVASDGVLDADSKQIGIQISWQPTPYENRALNAEGLLTHYVNPGLWPPE